jgi:hypothetical protein
MTTQTDTAGTSDTAPSNAIATQREHVLQRIAGVHERLERHGVGAAFFRVAKADPIGDMGFLGSMLMHAIVCGPIDELLAEYHLPGLTDEFGSALTLGGMEAASALDDTRDLRHIKRPRTAFYPLGRNKSTVKNAKTRKKFNAAASGAGGRGSKFSYEVQAELAGMFDLMDMLANLKAQDRSKHSHWVHLDVKKPSVAGAPGVVERRRRPRTEGMYSA